MDKIDNNETYTTAAQTPPTFRKTIGKTTYEVVVHFSATSTETMNDKIMRLIQNDSENLRF